MKRSSLEMIVLILGVTIIGGALFLMYAMSSNPNQGFFTNLIFALGFLIYIVYSMMSTNSLNKEIRGLNNHVNSLKESIVQKDKAIKAKEAEVSALNTEVSGLKEQLAASEANITSLQAKVKELEASISSEPEKEA